MKEISSGKTAMENLPIFSAEDFSDDCQSLEFLGEGGYGLVVKRILKVGNSEIPVAVKISDCDITSEIAMLSRFRNSPYTVQIIGFTDDSPELYSRDPTRRRMMIRRSPTTQDRLTRALVMELAVYDSKNSCAPGYLITSDRDEASLLRKRRLLEQNFQQNLENRHPPQLRREIILNFLLIIHNVHSGGILHGDIKPHNILWFGSGSEIRRPKICDLGSAMDFSPQVCRNFSITKTPLYNNHYRPPEISLHLDFDLRADVWALGCIMFEMIFKDVFIPSSEENFGDDHPWKKSIAQDIRYLLGRFSGTPKASRLLRMIDQNSIVGFPDKTPDQYVSSDWHDYKKTASYYGSRNEHDLLVKLLEPDFRRRLTIEEALNHPYFQKYVNYINSQLEAIWRFWSSGNCLRHNRVVSKIFTPEEFREFISPELLQEFLDLSPRNWYQSLKLGFYLVTMVALIEDFAQAVDKRPVMLALTEIFNMAFPLYAVDIPEQGKSPQLVARAMQEIRYVHLHLQTPADRIIERWEVVSQPSPISLITKYFTSTIRETDEFIRTNFPNNLRLNRKFHQFSANSYTNQIVPQKFPDYGIDISAVTSGVGNPTINPANRKNPGRQ